ncbi:MAG: hypothetical protein U0R19_08275 [Bryobacteraceae bacterium]
MRKELLIGVAIGLVLLGLAASGVLWVNKDSHVILEGKIQQVRTLFLEESASFMVVDFRVTNPSGYPFVVREVKVIVDGAEGNVVADRDAKRLFDYYKAIGPKFNDSLKPRDKVAAKQTVDRMVSARFELPESKLKDRKSLVVRIEEVDGMVIELKQP